MKIKRYVAPTMREAIAQIRAEQGPEAVILSNRSIDGGMEIIAAVDYDEGLMSQALAQIAPKPKAMEKPAAAAVPTPKAGASAPGPVSPSAPVSTPQAATASPPARELRPT